MKRHHALYLLSHDHRQGLILAQLLKKGAPHYKGMPSTLNGKKAYAISFYNSELIKHFNDEEKSLFPFVEGKNQEIDKLISELIPEHRKIELCVKNLEDSPDLEDLLDELGNLLEKHIRREERQLFVQIEEILEEKELSSIAEKLSRSGIEN